MNIEFIVGGIFIFITIIAFIAGMFFIPEFFGISKDTAPRDNDQTSVVSSHNSKPQPKSTDEGM